MYSLRIMIAIVLLGLGTVLGWADLTVERQTLRVSLFGGGKGSPPVVLESGRGWTPVATYDWEGWDMKPADPDRRWRLESSYRYGRVGGPVTLQIRLNGPAGNPVFTHPWSEISDGLADSYSNWFEDVRGYLNDHRKGYVEARVIAPPRISVSATLYSVTLEAWENGKKVNEKRERSVGFSPDVNLAFARPLPSTLEGKRGGGLKNNEALVSAALKFSLSFVEAGLEGDLPQYYRMQADPVRSLEDGRAMPRYWLDPPRSIAGVNNLTDYKRRFKYSIHPVSEIHDLFPEWFSDERPWQPDDNAYLFLGHRDKSPENLGKNVDYLVFIVQPSPDGTWQVTARPSDNRSQ